MSYFPLPEPWPKRSYKRGNRFFGAPRENSARKHAGCDLIAGLGTPVFAVADGVIIEQPRHFYRTTWQIAIRRAGYMVRYCEVLSPKKGGTVPKMGDRVKGGQVIAYVGKMKTDSMLHFEQYSGKPINLRRNDPTKFMRRSGLVNPTPLLALLRPHRVPDPRLNGEDTNASPKAASLA